jgi:hypothetical protein
MIDQRVGGCETELGGASCDLRLASCVLRLATCLSQLATRKSRERRASCHATRLGTRKLVTRQSPM